MECPYAEYMLAPTLERRDAVRLRWVMRETTTHRGASIAIYKLLVLSV